MYPIILITGCIHEIAAKIDANAVITLDEHLPVCMFFNQSLKRVFETVLTALAVVT